MDSAAAGGPAAALRVVITNLPQMLADIVCGVLRAEADFEVIGPLTSSTDLPRFVERTRPAVVIVGQEDAAMPAIGRDLMARDPSLTVLSIRADGQQGWIHRLVPTCEPITELSPENLVRTLRAHIQRN